MSSSTTTHKHPCPLCGGEVTTLRWSDHYSLGSITECRECDREFDPKKLDGSMGLKAALNASPNKEK